MVDFIAGADRSQAMLLPAMVDEYVGPDCAVRVIDAFVASLDLHTLGFESARPRQTGRPPYDPGALLRLYIYGYLNSLRSSRRLEKAARINLEVIWLLGRLTPDFKTIADFRRDNHCGITGACRAFVQFCRGANLFAGAIATIDGTKLAAAASRRKIMRAAEVSAAVVALDRRIGEYLAEMDVADQTESDDLSERATRAALEKLKQEREALLALSQAMAAEARTVGVLGEPEARPMGSGAAAKPPCYNVQIAVDPKSHVIVHHDVTTEATDNRLLHPMARATKAVLGAEAITVIADGGYANATQAAACEAEQITPVAPAPKPANPRGAFFAAALFRYDAASDSMTCPAGRRLVRNGGNTRDDEHRYRAADCADCLLKADCTTAPRRYVYRHVHHEAMQRMTARVAADKSLMTTRRSTAEHPFASLKAYLGRRFLLRGPLKAASETALAVLGYNLTRVTNLLGCRELVALLAGG